MFYAPIFLYFFAKNSFTFAGKSCKIEIEANEKLAFGLDGTTETERKEIQWD